MARGGFEVRTEGLRDFRRDLKRLDPQLDKELRDELKVAVTRVAVRAAATAPRRSGRLARSYRPFLTMRGAGVASTLPYAPVIEYGGTISPRGTPIKIRRYEPVTRAVEADANRIVEQFGNAVERAADRTGWRD
jgi:hypothetical protein